MTTQTKAAPLGEGTARTALHDETDFITAHPLCGSFYRDTVLADDLYQAARFALADAWRGNGLLSAKAFARLGDAVFAFADVLDSEVSP